MHDPIKAKTLTAATGTGSDGWSRRFFTVPTCADALVADMRAIAARAGMSSGYSGRTPDYYDLDGWTVPDLDSFTGLRRGRDLLDETMYEGRTGDEPRS